MAAAIILADKSDVRRSRVRNKNNLGIDIHDRVNYAVQNAHLTVNREDKTVLLTATIDTTISPVSDYFEIFLERMLLCRKASQFFDMRFALEINNSRLNVIISKQPENKQQTRLSRVCLSIECPSFHPGRILPHDIDQ
jgi:hypothetical protein